MPYRGRYVSGLAARSVPKFLGTLSAPAHRSRGEGGLASKLSIYYPSQQKAHSRQAIGHESRRSKVIVLLLHERARIDTVSSKRAKKYGKSLGKNLLKQLKEDAVIT